MKSELFLSIVMMAVGGLLIYLAIKKKMEPTLLLPMGFGAILVNIPNSTIASSGILAWLYNFGIADHEVFPLLLFIGIGAMIDFGPLLSKPWLLLIGIVSQGGIFITMLIASLFFPINDAASIGIIGAADGPTAIFVSMKLQSAFIAPILIVAYSYMALVPIIQPVVLKAMTTRKEREIEMNYSSKGVSREVRILFPIIITIISGQIASVIAGGLLLHFLL